MQSFATPKIGARVTTGALTNKTRQTIWQVKDDDEKKRLRQCEKEYRKILQTNA